MTEEAFTKDFETALVLGSEFDILQSLSVKTYCCTRHPAYALRGGNELEWRVGRHISTAILRTCWTTHAEGSAFLYARNTFSFNSTHDIAAFCRTLSSQVSR